MKPAAQKLTLVLGDYSFPLWVPHGSLPGQGIVGMVRREGDRLVVLDVPEQDGDEPRPISLREDVPA
jgi:hypothetical protein